MARLKLGPDDVAAQLELAEAETVSFLEMQGVAHMGQVQRLSESFGLVVEQETL